MNSGEMCIRDRPCSVRAASEIASRSRGTPRIANALLRRVRDFAQVKGSGSIDTEIAQFALEALNIDKYGLDEIDNKILCTIIDKFKGGPVGITTIATALGEDAGTIEEVYEPFLIKEGFMKRTPRGREVTELALSLIHISREVCYQTASHCITSLGYTHTAEVNGQNVECGI